MSSSKKRAEKGKREGTVEGLAHSRLRRRPFGFAPLARATFARVTLAAALCLAAEGDVVAGQKLASATAADWSDSGAEANSLVVHFDQVPDYYARLSADKLRLIVDVAHSGVAGAPGVLNSNEGPIAGAVIQGFSQPQPTTRIIVTLRKAAAYSVRAEGTDLRIQVGDVEAAPVPVAAPAPESAPADGNSFSNETASAKTPATAVSAQSGAAALKKTRAEALAVKDVRFERRGLEDRIELTAAEGSATAGEVQRQALRPGATRVTIPRTTLAAELERTLDVRAFGGCVTSVSSFRDRDSLVLDIEHCAGAQTFVARDSNGFLVRVLPHDAPSSASGVAADGRAARRTYTLTPEKSLPAEVSSMAALNSANEALNGDDQPLSETAVEPARAAAFAPAVLGQTTARFSGRRIDMDFKDADVHNVLRLLADAGHVNIVAADNVTGTVTIRMRNVPWDQAIDVVLQAKGLGMERSGNIIRVAPLADLQKERELAIARRKQELQLAPIETRLIPVSYAHAVDLQARAGDLLTGRGTIAVDERTNVMIVRDVAANLDQIEELTRSLDTQTPQVLIEARIVEATSRYLREVGVQWGGDASFSSATGNPTGLAFPSAIGLAGGASDQDTPTGGLSPFQNAVQNPNFAVNLPVATGAGKGGAIGLTLGSVDSNFNLSLRLSAAETSGMLRILSSPRVLTLDNQQARISQGTLIPFSQVSAQGVQTTFQEAKLQLLVKPHVTADGSVSMRVKINRDEPDFNQKSPRGDPTILKREAETELLVADGHTAVIGGIFTRNTGRNVDQVPFFGDLPLLGLLFQKRSTSDTRGELVIFLTPRIVNRAEALGR